MGITAALLCGLGALAQRGYLTSETEIPSSVSPVSGAELAIAGFEDLDVHGRQLQTVARTPVGYTVCPPKVLVENSTYPDLGFKLPEQAASAVVFQFAITLYMFLGLAIVCDSFFEASLSAICEAMNLQDDVAGATWMAAGGSAPELATSLLGLFISRSDVGFGTIVGSAVFNVLFVIACCAFAQPNLTLTWWPLARDCAYYCLSLAMIVIFVSDDLQIAVWEAAVLLLMYVVYVTIMAFNERLEVWVTGRVAKDESERSSMRLSLIKMIDSVPFSAILYIIIAANSVMVIMEMVDDVTRSGDQLWCVCGVYQGSLEPSGWYYANLAFNIFYIVEMLMKFYAYGFLGYWKVPLNCFDGSLVFLIVVEFILATNSDGIGIGVARLLRMLKFIRMSRIFRLVRIVLRLVVKPSAAGDNKVAPQPSEWNKAHGANGAEKEKEEKKEEEDDDDDDDGPFNPLEIPDSIFGKFFWFIGLPLAVLMWLTIPDCRRPFFGTRAWPLTFWMCIFWIGALSFIMVWMVEAFGKMYNIRDSIMGITLLAAGTSIPDCLSSIAVARRGHGDMAVSSSIGSNIFDVLFGLPFPWLLYTMILRPAIGEDFLRQPGDPPATQWVQILSESLAVMILSLFVMVALVVTTIHLSGWVLSIRLGLIMMVLYFLFLMLALLLEFNVVLPDCLDGPPRSAVLPPSAPLSMALGR